MNAALAILAVPVVRAMAAVKNTANILELPIVIRSNLCSNVIVTIYGDPNIGLLLVLDLYTIGIAIVPALQDFSLGELPDICVHGVSDIEAQILCSAFHQP